MIIQALTIYTTRIEQQCRFYSKVLGLEVNKISNSTYQFKIGNSYLRLQSAHQAKPYHFAINIPCNQTEEALVWLKERVKILRSEGNEIQEFVHWNARAIYFYDEDQNIVELIARKNLSNSSSQAFSPKSFLAISEIGLATLNIEEVYQQLNEKIGLKIYDGSFDRFCAIGDERGLFICIDKSKKDWFPLNDPASIADFETLIFNDVESFSVVYKAGNLYTFP